MEKRLTSKQNLFVSEYLIDLNATQAAIRAGYKGTRARQTASRMVTNGNIKVEIDKRIKEREEKTGITAEYVLTSLQEIAVRCMQKNPVVDSDGVVVLYKFDSSGANKALELLGKHLGLFTERLKIEGDGKGKRDYTNDELRAIITEGSSNTTPETARSS